MTSSVAAIEAQLAEPTLVSPVPADEVPGVKAMPPQARLAWLERSLTDLGIDAGFLSRAQQLVQQEHELQRRSFERSQRAAAERAAAVQRLVADPGSDLDEAASVWTATSAWVDVSAGQQRPPALAMVQDARRRLDSQIDGRVMAESERIFTLVQGRAAEAVAEVAALPPFPQAIWSSPAPAEELPRYQEHRPTWGVLTVAVTDFERCHAIASLTRDYLGYSADNLPDGAPRSALVFRNWRAALERQTELDRLKTPLKLAFAVLHDLEPGLWKPSDVKVTKADQTFSAKLRNLGQAVGVVKAVG